MDRESKIIVVGAGAFGLSTALHLARRGYKDVHIFDRQPYDKNHYNYLEGADAASADENKVLRASYGGQQLYQQLAFKAMPQWREWDKQLASTPLEDLPATFNPRIKLWNDCGYLRLNDNGLEQSEKLSQQNIPPEVKHTQYRVTDAQDLQRAASDGIPASKLDPLLRTARGLPVDGILDMSAGFVLAGRACAFALHLCRQAGVQLHLGHGSALKTIVYADGSGKVTGIRTADDELHSAALVIVACGGWTPSLVPKAEDLLETTAGSVFAFQLPRAREDLWAKYAPSHFPALQWRMAGYRPDDSGRLGGIYMIPRTPEGWVKIGFRGVKYTDYSHTSSGPSGRAVSLPRTGGDSVPAEAMHIMHDFCKENMPDLLDLELGYARLCWYTDSVDNSFLIDHVPGCEGLIVASGGSGHGFKFLPVLGEHVVDVVERKETDYTRLFKWREVPQGKQNGLEEGPQGSRVLAKQDLAGREEWKQWSRPT